MPPSRFPVSPGLASRPSLSEFRVRVAGIPVPAFVERALRVPVSPGFRSRPSLSEAELALRVDGLRVSPGFRSRPSLSVPIGEGSLTAARWRRRDSGPGLRLERLPKWRQGSLR